MGFFLFLLQINDLTSVLSLPCSIFLDDMRIADAGDGTGMTTDLSRILACSPIEIRPLVQTKSL